jgi:hypothetical protein
MTASNVNPGVADGRFAMADVVTELDLLKMRSRQLDALFRESPAGAIPDGDGRGTILLLTGTLAGKALAAVAYPLAWQGKVVAPELGTLINKLTPVRLRAVRADVSIGPSWVDGRDCVVIDYSRTSWVAQWIRDEIRTVAPGLYLGVVWLRGHRVGAFALRFPAQGRSDR